ncbi:MAG: lipopolysaccharide heptosyltransferase I [Campylobacteraceae bacterium 4484_166]|nr:MAG: lipopolysaccharide heptosyltransferase I [Campylobacteraceae bacterium 4484_166]
MKICIVKLSALGDIIHTMVSLQFIKKLIKDIEIDWIVEESFADILSNNKDIDKIIPINLKSIKRDKFKIFSQIKNLNKISKNRYDVVIDAQGLIKSAIVSKIVGNKIVGSYIAGFDKNSTRESAASWFYDKKIAISYDKNVIIRNCHLIASTLDIDISTKDILSKQPFLYSNGYKDESNNIIFVVGASKRNKIYPKENFLLLANILKQPIDVIWANDYEKKVAIYLSNHSSYVDMANRLTLDELKYKISKTKLLIGGDTGPTHMAWALNRPSITIYGNTPAKRNSYETDINKTIDSNSFVDANKLDKDDFSIKNIAPQDIANIANKLLKGKI